MSTVATQKLADADIQIPVTQSFLFYALLAFVYSFVTLYKSGIAGFDKAWRIHWVWYLIMGTVDVQGNYFTVKAYSYTNIMSAMLLDTWAIPVVMILSIIFLSTNYSWGQYAGVVVAIAGMAILVVMDVGSNSSIGVHDENSQKEILGDLFCLLGATFYGISNVLQEWSLRKRPLYEVLMGLGIVGSVVSGVQISIIERDQLASVSWNGEIIGYLFLFTFTLFSLYSFASVLFRISSATFFNLSLLTSDFYGLVASVLLFGAVIRPMYVVAFLGIVVGIVLYNVFAVDDDEVKEQPKSPNLEEYI